MSERELFGKALAIVDPAERAAFLDQACAGNALLRARVDALLASHVASNDSLAAATAQAMVPPQNNHDPLLESDFYYLVTWLAHREVKELIQFDDSKKSPAGK